MQEKNDDLVVRLSLKNDENNSKETKKFQKDVSSVREKIVGTFKKKDKKLLELTSLRNLLNLNKKDFRSYSTNWSQSQMRDWAISTGDLQRSYDDLKGKDRYKTFKGLRFGGGFAKSMIGIGLAKAAFSKVMNVVEEKLAGIEKAKFFNTSDTDFNKFSDIFKNSISSFEDIASSIHKYNKNRGTIDVNLTSRMMEIAKALDNPRAEKRGFRVKFAKHFGFSEEAIESIFNKRKEILLGKFYENGTSAEDTKIFNEFEKNIRDLKYTLNDFLPTVTTLLKVINFAVKPIAWTLNAVGDVFTSGKEYENRQHLIDVYGEDAINKMNTVNNSSNTTYNNNIVVNSNSANAVEIAREIPRALKSGVMIK